MHEAALHHTHMKITKTKEVNLAFSEETPIFFDKFGIHPMLYVDGKYFDYPDEELRVTWDNMFKCAKDSCVEHVKEADVMIVELRRLADRLERWQIKDDDEN